LCADVRGVGRHRADSCELKATEGSNAAGTARHDETPNSVGLGVQAFSRFNLRREVRRGASDV